MLKHFSTSSHNLFLVLLVSATLTTATSPSAIMAAGKIDRESLVEDARQLADMIEKTHPGPYANGGGKTAFHRRLQSILAKIPAEGMTRVDFYRLLRPFVVAIGDAHTWLRDAYDDSSASPGGIPLYFGIVGTDLYVLGVPEERYRPLIGAILVSVEGVPFRDLLIRSRSMVSAENEYQLLRNLAYTGFLFSRPFLADLVPEWQDKSRVRIVLRDSDGHETKHTIPIPSELPGAFVNPGSRMSRPRAGPAGFAHAFIDSQRTTALLVVDHLQGYREMYEEWRIEDSVSAALAARDLYQKLYGKTASDNLDSVIAGLPSATEAFRSLVREMREAGTKTLLVDLRYNEGGNSTMYNVLLYFLYGRDALVRAKCHRTEIRRLAGNGYDYSADWYGRILRDSAVVTDLRAEFEREVARMPTFADEYASGRFERYYLPSRVIVLSSPRTFSSGYTLMYYLYRAGATIVGTPSAQAGNCFGEPANFELEHSRLTGTISRKQYIYFHDDPEAGRVLCPQRMMTYDDLGFYAFDLNTEILLALDMCKQ